MSAECDYPNPCRCGCHWTEDDVVQQLHADLSDDLARIAKRFKAPKITLIVRNPALADGDVVLTDDDVEAAIAALRRLQARQKR